MTNKYQKKGVHTSPEKAGVQNFTPAVLENAKKDDDGINDCILDIMNSGTNRNACYKGQWTPEELASSVNDFFLKCAEMKLKPTQPLLRLWLGISRDQMWEWKTMPERHSWKSDIIKKAMDFMEAYLQANIDKYPTGNIFLLKTSHGHVEANRLDITSQGQRINANEDEIADIVAKLGLKE